MVDTHCSHEAEKKRQRQTVKHILELKGHDSFNRRASKSNHFDRGIFTGTIEYDAIAQTHIHMHKIIHHAKTENELFDL